MDEQTNFDPLVLSSMRSRRSRPWIGVHLTTANSLCSEYGKGSGPVISKLTPGGPAARAGLLTKDIVLKVDDEFVDAPEKFTKYLWNRSVGETISVLVMRGRQEQIFQIEIGSEFSHAVIDE